MAGHARDVHVVSSVGIRNCSCTEAQIYLAFLFVEAAVRRYEPALGRFSQFASLASMVSYLPQLRG